ncbi:hypothetical protein [Rhizobium leguminosarum]|uniref:hypothetical protein n=1 Tax=Rhizobium leguminosarum TaxID=384 RepID=UPI00102F5192|nr:hypothetical protein [Rhizobium leguminosarum]TBF80830.1 hypothetical protein ELG86_01105 [Rhizobium leguminosarum]
MNISASTAPARASLSYPVVVLGRDDSGKAHASYFSAADGHMASRAANLMGMLALRADNDAIRSLLPKLPKGKLFDSGKAFVPFVKQDLYQQIAAHLPEADRAKAEAVRAAPTDVSQQGHAATPSNVPDDWSKIAVGSLVLATEDPLDGWFEATVIELKPDSVLRLQWRHYLDLPPFNRKLEDVALLHPTMKL